MILSIIMWFVVGAIIALILASGGGRARVDIELLGKEIDQRWVVGILLFNVIAFWPVALWLMVMGRKADGSAQAPPMMQPGDKYVSDFYQSKVQSAISQDDIDRQERIDAIQDEARRLGSTVTFKPPQEDGVQNFTLRASGMEIDGKFNGPVPVSSLRSYVKQLVDLMQSAPR